jgi:hypothetical protein
MTTQIEVRINLDNLPDAPNHHKLAVALEERINQAVALALADTYDHGFRGKDWTVHVPSF